MPLRRLRLLAFLCLLPGFVFGQLYVRRSDQILKVDPVSGAQSPVFSAPAGERIGDLIRHGSNALLTVLWHYDFPDPEDDPLFRWRIMSVNPATGTGTTIYTDALLSNGVPSITVGMDQLIYAGGYLTSWSSLGTVSLSGGAVTCHDVDATNSAARFYRASHGGKRTSNPFGYVVSNIPTGLCMVGIQFNATNSGVRSLFGDLTNSLVASKYLPATTNYLHATNSSGVWSGPDFSLIPGDGIFVQNLSGSDFDLTFKGEVLQGVLSSALPAGFSVHSAPVPQAGLAASIMGLSPLDGDEVQRYDNGSSEYDVFHYFDGLGWHPSAPEAALNEAVWYHTSSAQVAQRTFSVWP